jgi:hypothetical protein
VAGGRPIARRVASQSGAESQRQLWEQAAAITSNHSHEPFCTEVATSVGNAQFSPITNRAEAGAAVRRLMHDYQSAAALQRQRLRGVVARYRGFDLVVQAHAVFAADLTLALPGGATLDTVTAATDTGVWQSVSRILGEIPRVLERLHGRIGESHERIATIDRELVRLEAWDGQTTYDAAVSELSAINAAFAAAEEQTDTEPSATATPATEATTRPAAETPPDEASLSDLLLALAQEERAGDDWCDWATVIPPAPASLAWMAAEIERQPVHVRLHSESLGVEAPETEGVPMLTQEVGYLPAMGSGQAQFGNPASQRRPLKPHAPTLPNDEVEVTQLSLF